MRIMNSKSLFESFQENLAKEALNESANEKVIFDSDNENYIDSDNSFDQDAFENDWFWVRDEIDSNINSFLILKGSNQTWNRSGEGYKVTKDINEMIDNFDGIKLTQTSNGLELYCYDHDGHMSGILYTIKSGVSDDEIEELLRKYFDDEDFSMYYFQDWAGSGMLQELEKAGYLEPINLGGITESALEPQYEGRKSYYGKADVREENGWKILKSYSTDIMKVKDGKFEMITNDVDDLTQTTLRHIREFLQQEGITPPKKSELVKMIQDKDLNEEDEFESYSDFSDGDIIQDLINNYKSITGKDYKEVFNYDPEAEEGIFKQKEIDATAPAIQKYLADKGIDKQRADELLYKLDDELTSIWYKGLKENVKMNEQDQVVRVVTNVQEDRDYTITDITELNQVADGDVQPPIDITGLLNEVDARLNESVGTDWGVINYQSTRFNSDTKDSNALFELCVGDKTYLMSMLLEENGSLLKVNNTKGQTIFKRKSNDMVGLAESYIKQFIPKKEKEKSYIVKHMNNDLHSRLTFIQSHIKELKSAPKEEKEAFRAFIQNEIYGFVAELSSSIDKEEPNDDDTSKLPTFDDMVKDVFGKEWVKEPDKENKLELDGVEVIKESAKPFIRRKDGSEELTKSEVREKWKEAREEGGWTTKEYPFSKYLQDIDDTQEWELVHPLKETNYLKKYPYEKLQKMSDKELYKAWLEVKDAPDEEKVYDKFGAAVEYNPTLASDALWDIEGELCSRGFMDEDSNKTEKWSELTEAEEPENIGVKDTPMEEPSEDANEVEVSTPKSGLGTGYASFARKPANVEEVEKKQDSFTSGESSYIIVSKEVLSADEFDKLANGLSTTNEYCKKWEPEDTDNYSFNVIEFSCPDYDYKLLVDPSGFDYCRYVAKVPTGGNK